MISKYHIEYYNCWGSDTVAFYCNKFSGPFHCNGAISVWDIDNKPHRLYGYSYIDGNRRKVWNVNAKSLNGFKKEVG